MGCKGVQPWKWSKHVMYLMNVFLVDAPTTMSVMALLVAYSIIALEMSLLSKMTSFRCICGLQMPLN